MNRGKSREIQEIIPGTFGGKSSFQSLLLGFMLSIKAHNGLIS